MKDFTKNLKDGLAKTSQFIKASSEEAVNKLKEGAEMVGAIGPVAKDKVVDMVNDVIDVLPLLEEAGYTSNEFKIGVALSPVIEMSFTKVKDLTEEEMTALKNEHHNKKMFNMILGMLTTSTALSSQIEANEFEFYESIIEITIPPKVSLRYVRKKKEAIVLKKEGEDA